MGRPSHNAWSRFRTAESRVSPWTTGRASPRRARSVHEGSLSPSDGAPKVAPLGPSAGADLLRPQAPSRRRGRSDDRGGSASPRRSETSHGRAESGPDALSGPTDERGSRPGGCRRSPIGSVRRHDLVQKLVFGHRHRPDCVYDEPDRSSRSRTGPRSYEIWLNGASTISGTRSRLSRTGKGSGVRAIIGIPTPSSGVRIPRHGWLEYPWRRNEGFYQLRSWAGFIDRPFEPR